MFQWIEPRVCTACLHQTIKKINCESFLFVSLCLSHLVMISYILPLQCHYRYLYFTLDTVFRAMRRNTGSKAGMNCSQLRGKDKPERESWQASFSLPLETSCLCLPGASVLLFPSFLEMPSLLSVYREKGGSGQVPSWEWPGASEFPGRELDRPPVSAGCACFLNDLRGWQLEDRSLTSEVSESWV